MYLIVSAKYLEKSTFVNLSLSWKTFSKKSMFVDIIASGKKILKIHVYPGNKRSMFGEKCSLKIHDCPAINSIKIHYCPAKKSIKIWDCRIKNSLKNPRFFIFLMNPVLSWEMVIIHICRPNSPSTKFYNKLTFLDLTILGKIMYGPDNIRGKCWKIPSLIILEKHHCKYTYFRT